MATPTTKTTPIPAATPAQQRAFWLLRERYQQNHDLFTPQEWNRLLFLRWLYAQGAMNTQTPADPASTARPVARHAAT